MQTNKSYDDDDVLKRSSNNCYWSKTGKRIYLKISWTKYPLFVAFITIEFENIVVEAVDGPLSGRSLFDIETGTQRSAVQPTVLHNWFVKL